MLLTSPGDHGSSLPVNSLPLCLPEHSLAAQISIEGDRVIAASSLEVLVESCHVPSPLQDELSSSSLPDAEASTPSRDRRMKATNSVSPKALYHAGPKSLSQELDLDGLYALRQAAALKALRQSRTRPSNRRSFVAPSDTRAADSHDVFSFAAPLSPLRQRDLTALTEFFGRDDMPAIEVDISQRLISLLPEPCWEDDAFDFLKEFL